VEIRDRALKLQSFSDLLNTPDLLPVGDQRTRTVNESTRLFEWLVDQLDGGLVDMFKPFLKLDDPIRTATAEADRRNAELLQTAKPSPPPSRD
jgi:hypothetical protein